MPQRLRTRTTATDPDRTLAGRLLSALVAVLYFAPLLALTWFAGNELAARTGSNLLVSPHWLKVALGVAVVLGFLVPRLIPSLFGWLATGFFGIARYLWWGWWR